MLTYGDLYIYLEKYFIQRQNRNIELEDFSLTKNFCKINNISNVSRLIQILSDYGASNDIEIIWNVTEMIPDDTPINKDLDTPIEFALKNNYYTKWHEGMWVKCKKNDIGSMPDLNTATQKLYEINKKKN